MKKVLILIFLIWANIASATDYYVSNTGNNSNAGTIGSPWQTISKVQTVLNNGTIVAGDRIFFKKGDTFTGSMSITGGNNGTLGNEITISSYGTGARPFFMYPTGGATPAESRVLMYFQGKSYFIIEDINFSDLDLTPNHIAEANCGVPLYLGSYGDFPVDHFIIRNVDIQGCGMGVVLWGSDCYVHDCTMSNFKNLKSTSGGGGEDYGANPFTIGGDRNIIENNVVSDGWAESLDFGYNGGFAEMIGPSSENQFIRNTIYDTNGFSEFGNIGGNAHDNIYAYNVVKNCGAMFWANSSIQVNGTLFYQNTVIETDDSRFSQGSPNAGAGVVTAEAILHLNVDQYIFGVQGQSGTTVYEVRNCIFEIHQGGSPDMTFTNAGSKTNHQYSLYKLSGISSGYTLSTGESTTSSTIFILTTGTPDTWDVHLSIGSPGEGAGTTITISITAPSNDIEYDDIGTPRNLGAYGPESASPTVPTKITVPVYLKIGGVKIGPFKLKL